MDERPIGIFDSGLGGLTAAEELRRLMPSENIIYIGDSYNMPYGEKTPKQIVSMSRNNLRFLLEHNVKAVFIACGTATTNALDILRKECPVPVFGVVEPAVKEAVEVTENGRVGILATRASVASGEYQRLLKKLSPELFVTASACPKFAGMVEEGIFDRHDERVLIAAGEYLPPLKTAKVDTIILGCTHYPLLADVITDFMGGVKLISSGAAAARSLCALLVEKGMTREGTKGETRFYTTGEAKGFAEKAGLMLGCNISGRLREIQPLCFDRAGKI
jgi:glutamate racemase